MATDATLLTPLPGWFGVVKTGSKTIEKLQRLNGSPDEDAVFTHAFVVIENGQVVEAEGNGARIANLAEYDPRNVYYPTFHLSDTQRQGIVQTAKSLVGTPYSYFDYFSLLLLHYHVRPWFVVDYVTSTRHMICSQIADYCFMKNGVHLFQDNRFPGDVTPADLRGISVVTG